MTTPSPARSLAPAKTAAVAVRRAASPLLQRKCACGGKAGLSGRCPSCESEARFGTGALSAKPNAPTSVPAAVSKEGERR
jgi:hypothetical protein